MYRTALAMLLVAGVFAGPCCHAAFAAPRPPAAQSTPAPLNLNEITVEQLDELPGIGPALAERIVDHRDAHGPFTRVEELGEVKGIGPRTLDKLRPYLFVE